MAYKVKWSPKAAEDVEAIASYVSQDSPSYAAAIVNEDTRCNPKSELFPFFGTSRTGV